MYFKTNLLQFISYTMWDECSAIWAKCKACPWVKKVLYDILCLQGRKKSSSLSTWILLFSSYPWEYMLRISDPNLPKTPWLLQEYKNVYNSDEDLILFIWKAVWQQPTVFHLLETCVLRCLQIALFSPYTSSTVLKSLRPTSGWYFYT